MIDRARLGKARKVAELGEVLAPVVVLDAPAPVAELAAPVVAAPVAEQLAPVAELAAPVVLDAPEQAEPVGRPEPITGELDPLTLNLLAEIPDRPKRRPAASDELAELAELAEAERVARQSAVKKAGPLVAAGGVLLGVVAWMAYGSRRAAPNLAEPVAAAEGPVTPGPASPAPATPGRVVTVGGRVYV